ncbi:MAG: HAD-IIB family hydrolase [Methanosarcinales archaeon]|nr:HAD-IIB family hydrolase [ANME-2 cluster archaeon]MDF1530976.1 HAD-IIB family hydrolase [ANME-2 cluster archaeon]MDW7775079.1 HAD-IIB family hydrolase [Methanosarcinales archaeon]
MPEPEYVIYTDMDGTLIDHDTYSYQEALPALDLIRKKHIPLVFCTSKTRAELEVYCKELELYHPLISENGGAIFIPYDYFDFPYDYDKISDHYRVIELGVKYDILEKTLKEVCTDIQCEAVGFGDMDVDEVCMDTGLSAEAAALAKRRDYDEAFRVLSPAPKGDELVREIVRRGFNCTRGGRYYHIMGNNDKGRAVEILTGLYRRTWPGIRTIGLGDSLNDLPMLKAVDIAILVQKPGGFYDPAVTHPGIKKGDGIGPEGWNRELINILR